MRWGAGAGASRLISGNMDAAPTAGVAAGGVQGLRGGAALRLGLPGQHRARSPRSPAAATVVFSDELNHASIVDGCRLSRAETFVYRHADARAPRLGPARGRRARLADRHRRRLLDGRRRRPAGRSWQRLAREHDCRLMVDEAHATGALGPGGRGSVAAAGLSGEVDVVDRHPGQGARLLRRLRMRQRRDRRLPGQLRPALHLLHRPATRRRRRGAGGAGAARVPTRPLSTGCWRTRRRCARALAAEGLAAGGSETQIVPVEVGDAARAMELSERAAGARRLRPGNPPADGARGSSRLRFTVMATHRAEELRRRRGNWSVRQRGTARRLRRHVSPALAA